MIEELENIKLIRELNYLKSEFDYKNSLVQSYNIEFLTWIENILELNQDLKQVYEKKKNIRIDSVNKPVVIMEKTDEESEVETTEDEKLKGIYRQIVKITHPDKIKTDSFSSIYQEANFAFKEGNTVDMLLLCDRLGLSYDITSQDKEFIKKEVINLKNKISLLESSFSYQWATVDDETIKTKIAMSYIRAAIA